MTVSGVGHEVSEHLGHDGLSRVGTVEALKK
jgi:hypothetical protein